MYNRFYTPYRQLGSNYRYPGSPYSRPATTYSQPAVSQSSRVIPAVVQGRIIGAGDIAAAARQTDRATLSNWLRQPGVAGRLTSNAVAAMRARGL